MRNHFIAHDIHSHPNSLTSSPLILMIMSSSLRPAVSPMLPGLICQWHAWQLADAFFHVCFWIHHVLHVSITDGHTCSISVNKSYSKTWRSRSRFMMFLRNALSAYAHIERRAARRRPCRRRWWTPSCRRGCPSTAGSTRTRTAWWRQRERGSRVAAHPTSSSDLAPATINTKMVSTKLNQEPRRIVQSTGIG